MGTNQTINYYVLFDTEANSVSFVSSKVAVWISSAVDDANTLRGVEIWTGS